MLKTVSKQNVAAMGMVKVPIVELGNTKLKVSKLGYGTYDFGTSALNISPEEGGQILTESYKLGINFWDTSDDYGSHPHVASALKYVPRKEVIISTKTFANDSKKAEENLKSSLRELNTDYIDIFLLHFVKTNWIDRCQKVLKGLKNLKATGIVKAVGLSTHSAEVAKKASQFEELDIIMAICCNASQALINKFQKHIPLEDGSIDEMFHALRVAHKKGKGIIAMKVLGDGASPLVSNYQLAIKTISKLDFVDAMVIGMQNLDEVKKNVNVLASM